jgi:hypothetical protein
VIATDLADEASTPAEVDAAVLKVLDANLKK